jgi:hypothetical protein
MGKRAMKKLKEKLEKRQENGAEKVEMSYTYRAIRAAEHLRTLSKNGGWGVRRGREDKCDKKGGCIRNLFKIVFTHGKKFYILLN